MEAVIVYTSLAVLMLCLYDAVVKIIKRQYLALRWKEFAYDKNKSRMAFDLIDRHLTHAIPDDVPVPQRLPHLSIMRTDVYFDHSEEALGLYIIDAVDSDHAVLYVLPKKYYPHEKLKRNDDLRQETLEMIRNAITCGFITKVKGKPYVYREDD